MIFHSYVSLPEGKDLCKMGGGGGADDDDEEEDEDDGRVFV